MIDNYDSFTFNIVQYLQELQITVKTYRNDELSVKEILSEKPDFLLISPGPSTPDHAGICLELIRAAAAKKLALFGVCLGMQAIGQSFGGNVIKAKECMHGKTSDIHHHNSHSFKNLPNPFIATRYHSLIVEKKTLPSCLEITAESEDGNIMGLKHKDYKIEGMQFHPESVLTQNGHRMLANFAETV